MKKTLSYFAAIFMLSSCGIVHKMDIEQGNVMTPEMVHQLHPGMSRSQVEQIMGTPLLLNTFNDNRVNYVYTFKTGNSPRTEKSLVLTFKNGILRDIQGNQYAEYD